MFEQLEYEIMSLISSELPEMQDLIINQYINCSKSREFTGHGFFTYFTDVVENRAEPRSCSEHLGKLTAVLNESCTVGFVLFMRDGKIICLEGYTFGEPWPQKIHTYSIIYNDYEKQYYDILKCTAEKVKVNENECVVCMISGQKTVYSIVERINRDSEKDIFDKLMAVLPENDREIIAIACFFVGMCLELPGYNFRSALLKMNPANSKAVIYANGWDGIIEKSISDL